MSASAADAAYREVTDKYGRIYRIVYGRAGVLPAHSDGGLSSAANAGTATKAVGLLEMLLGVWAFTGWQAVKCALVQTGAIVAMNSYRDGHPKLETRRIPHCERPAA